MSASSVKRVFNMSSVYRYFFTGVAFIAVLVSLYLLGYSNGKNAAKNDYLAQQLKHLEQMIDKNKTLTAKAHEVSTGLERLLSAQNETNITTTKEIRDALKKTSASRVHCELPSSVMQQLEAARRRAATATTASAINNLLPTTRSNNR